MEVMAGERRREALFVFFGLLFGSRTKGILEGVGKGLK